MSKTTMTKLDATAALTAALTQAVTAAAKAGLSTDEINRAIEAVTEILSTDE